MTMWTKDQEAEALKRRFEALKRDKGISRAAFARTAGIKGGDSMINQHITGHRPLSKDAAIAYAKGFGCSLHDISPRLASEAEDLAAFIEGESVRVDTSNAPHQSAAPAITYAQIKATVSGFLNAFGLDYAELVPDEATVETEITAKLLRLSNTGNQVEKAKSLPSQKQFLGHNRADVDAPEAKKNPRKRAEGGQ